MIYFSVVFRVMTHHPADGDRRQRLIPKTFANKNTTRPTGPPPVELSVFADRELRGQPVELPAIPDRKLRGLPVELPAISGRKLRGLCSISNAVPKRT